MDPQPSAVIKAGVTLLRPGVDAQEIELPEGATLADLLREARADTSEQAIFIDGRPVEEWIVLQPNVVVSLVPRVRNATRPADWRETVGMFRDDPVFAEIAEAGRAIREAGREAARQEANEDVP